MDEAVLAERVEMLEETVRALVTLPARTEAVEGCLTVVENRLGSVEQRLGIVEMQIVELRGELHGEFSVIRGDMASAISEPIQALQAAMNERFDALYERGEDTRRFMRMLHEDVLDRLARLGESRGRL